METGTEATRKAVSELRRISGLTWEQLAGLFGVSRRAVHFWASGKPLNATNHQRLMRVLDVVRGADVGQHAARVRPCSMPATARPRSNSWRTSGFEKHMQPLAEGARASSRR